ncbi:hypothetical protein Tco_0217895 [Tanacetum coccineum]
MLLVADYGCGVRMMAYDGDGVGYITSVGDGDGVDSRDDGMEMGRGGEVAVVERAAVEQEEVAALEALLEDDRILLADEVYVI